MKYIKSVRKFRTPGGKQPPKTDAKFELLQYITHDMKAPLHSILGFTENIKRKMTTCMNSCSLNEDDLANSIMRDLNIVIRESERLKDMISNVLDYSGFQNNSITLEKSSFDVEGLMEEISEFISPLIKGNSLEYRLDMQKSMPPIIADRSRLLQVLKNLVTNAVKFTLSGMIVCRVEFKDGMFHFSVADTGCGIPDDKKKKVFDKFYRTDSINSLCSCGNGLGLSICRSIVELHNGEIWLEDGVPQGTVFHFSIPV